MKLVLIKSLWGVTPATSVNGWSSLLKKYEDEGYLGVEAIMLTYLLDPHFLSALKSSNLFLLPQIHTSGGYLSNSEYVYSSSLKVQDHVNSLKDHLEKIKNLGVDVRIVNLHSGHDFWSTHEALEYFKSVEELKKDYPYEIVHETHRQRYLNSPRNYANLVEEEGMGSVRFNADLSHWACVSERLFTSPLNDDFYHTRILPHLSKTCNMIHARIGHSQGPQIFNTSEEWREAVKVHLEWWDVIWSGQRDRGLELSYVTTEFGPDPYVRNMSEKELDDINTWMKDIIIKRFEGDKALPPVLRSEGLKVINEYQIKEICNYEIAVDAAEFAFKNLSKSQSPVPIQLSFPERGGETCIKPGYINGAPFFACKVASGFQKNKEEGEKSGSGVVMVFDAKLGVPAAVLADNGYLTDLRTAAAVVLASKTFSSPKTVGVLGCGVMAELCIKMINELMGVESFKCWSRTERNVDNMISRLSGFNVEKCGTPEDAVSECELIITTTCATTPILTSLKSTKNVTIVAMGSDTPGKRELGEEVMREALGRGKVYADVKSNCLKLGECQYFKEEEGRIEEFGECVEGGGREGEEFIVVDLTGTGVQDAAIASRVMEAL